MKQFPKDFLMGASTAAHQVEGNNIHSDYWTMELMKSTSFVEPSADAVDHYNRYEEDIRLLADTGLNCYRFSIEWARIEPVEGQFDEAEVEHYRKMIRFCKDNGVTPIVTLHHFTSPKWLISKGGWEAESTVEDFKRYCAYIAEKLGDELTYIVTINEANMGLQLAAIAKRYMKELLFKKKKQSDGNDGKAQVGINLKQMIANQKIAAAENAEVFGTEKLNAFVSQRTPEGDLLIMRAHTAARDAMKAICPHLKIGLSLSLHDMQPLKGGTKHAAREWYAEFGHYLPYIKDDDFIGVQNYTRSRFGFFGQIDPPKDAELTQMSYEFYPEALSNVIRAVHKEFKGDIIVTENGIATTDDTRRVEFIRRALEGVRGCIDDGIPVKGYCHWSLLDNFEWQKGFSMTFGLIAVDRKSQIRFPKESLAFLGSCFKNQ
ncbi:MAG: glycoside hydrolase family 1 protein [Ruminococcaceae bacterium]|nr:glycoside hydrolase family 1 protein [Oscillospiraceae bacterium]